MVLLGKCVKWAHAEWYSLSLCQPKYSVSPISRKVLIELVEIYHKRRQILLPFAAVQFSPALHDIELKPLTQLRQHFPMDELPKIEKFIEHEKLLVGKQFNYCNSIVKKFICKYVYIYRYTHINTCMCVCVSLSFIHLSVHSFSILSYGRAIASSKTSSWQTAFKCLFFQFPTSSGFLKVIKKLFTPASSSYRQF